MSGVRRIFVEKKEGFNVEARSLLSDFRDNLLINGLKNLRVILRYDVEGLSDEEFQAALNTVFSEPPVDKVYLEELPVGEGEYAFGVEYLAGQFDQRSDSAAQCVQLLTTGRRPEVAAAKIYALEGYLRSADIEKIKRYVINPVDSKEAGMDKPKTLKMELPEPPDVKIAAGFSRFTDEELEAFRREGGYAMSLNDLAFTRGYFESEGRDPYITELRVIDTYWSDHCRHTTFLTELTEVDFEEGPVGAKVREVYNHYLALRNEVYGGRKKPVTLMDMATVYVKAMKKRGLLKKLDDSEEINACSFKHTLRTKEGDKEYLILFKNETHNHPTEIEPFGGAATCLGGAIRDPLSGRAYVYQAMRVTGSGDPREKTQDTLPHKLPQRKITKGAAAGYSSYGNQIGLATGLVRELYHPGYKAKRMEIGAVIAATPKENVRRERPEEGDIVVLIGGRTGRDGIGGATGSSKAHTTESTEACGAEVQKGNAPTERKLQRLFRKKEFTRLVKRCNDFGAGGVSVAIGELADSLDIDLNAVLKKYDGLDGTELAISESQERMAVVVEKEHLSRVIALAEEENLEAVKVAEVTNTGCMRMFWRNKNIVNIKRAFLNTNGAAQYAKARIASPDIKSYLETEADGSLKEAVKAILSDLNVCSQKGLIELFDSTIGAGTVHMPLGGRTQLTPAQTMAALVSTEGSISKDATLMSFGLDPYLMEKSPFHGAVYSVVASIAKIVAAGGTYQNTWLTLQEYFESLGSDPLKWGRPASALLGALYAQQGFSVVSIGGKDSMSGTYEDLTVPPTLCSFAVAVESAEELVSGEFKKAGDSLYLLELDSDQLSLPVFETMKKKYDAFYELVKEGKVKAAYAVEQGGILAAAAKMAMGNKIGLELEDHLSIRQIARKEYGSLIFETEEEISSPYFNRIGTLIEEKEIRLRGESITLEEAVRAFTAPLEKVFPTKTPRLPEAGDYPSFSGLSKAAPKIRAAKPRVVIPVFPGTNCEYDSAAMFERAGGEPQIIVIQNRTEEAVKASVAALAKAIRGAQILMLPGGFSGGDEPDGSGKFIATFLRNPEVAEAVTRLLDDRDGLMLGVCNGFQALIKLGLVPYGKILPMGESSPTLTFNTIGRHVSCLARTRVCSKNSPWLMGVEEGEVHTVAVSHGEGRFVCGKEELSALFAKGQVATRYCGERGEYSMNIPVNPNGSMAGVEGLLSPDGRVFGKMAHSERYVDGLFKNVPGNKDQKLAESGVKYFL